MSDITLFISFRKIDDFNSTAFTDDVMGLGDIINTQFIENDAKGNSQFEIEINKLDEDKGSDLCDLFLTYEIKQLAGLGTSFSQHLSGTSDPYGASGISMDVESRLTEISGVIDAGISPNGIIRVELIPDMRRCQKILSEILKEIKKLKQRHV